jgi:dienelactone hydrolase
MSTLNSDEAKAKVMGAVEYLRRHPAVRGHGLGAIGFSMGGAWALDLSTLMPEDIAAVVVFYGTRDADFPTPTTPRSPNSPGSALWPSCTAIWARMQPLTPRY